MACDVAAVGADNTFNWTKGCRMNDKVRLGGTRHEMNVCILPADFFTQKRHRCVTQIILAVAGKGLIAKVLNRCHNFRQAGLIVVIVKSNHFILFLQQGAGIVFFY